jgi:hypothetical protein
MATRLERACLALPVDVNRHSTTRLCFNRRRTVVAFIGFKFALDHILVISSNLSWSGRVGGRGARITWRYELMGTMIAILGLVLGCVDGKE